MSSPADQSPTVSATGWRANSIRSRSVETVRRNGREYLQFPLVPLTEMVLNYPERGTKEYLPAKSIRETAGLWDGTLLTFVHPNNRNGTVRDPDEFMGSVIGAFHDPRPLNGGEKLSGNGLIDVEKAKDIGGTAAELVGLLQNGEEVSVSAGYTTTEDEHRPGQFDGEQYDLVQGPPLPDHIAIFPSDARIQARCSPEDGCAAPRANASQLTDGQYANQRATSGTNGVRANMSDSESASNSGSVFPSAEERDRAIRAIQRENPNVGPEIKNNPDSTILTIAQGTADYQLPGCDCGGGGTCECQRTNARNRSRSRSSRSRSSRSPRKAMAAVPGQVDRDVGRERTRENADEYPAGGRKAWERRQLGLDGDSDGDDLPPAGGRSDWERRKQNARVDAEQSGAETHLSAGARRSLLARQNGVDASKVANAEYPLTALRAAQRRAEKRKRQAELKEIAKRNDVPLRDRRNL